MRKRLQLLLDEQKLSELQRLARQKRMTLAQWVRQALRLAQEREGAGNAAAKLDVVRRAARHAFPTGDIGHVLTEIDRGLSRLEP